MREGPDAPGSNTADSGATAHARTHAERGACPKRVIHFRLLASFSVSVRAPLRRPVPLTGDFSPRGRSQPQNSWPLPSGQRGRVCCEPWPARRRCSASRRSPSTTSPRTAGSSSPARCMMSPRSWMSILVEMRYCWQ
nr:uncharacterized protein LOC109778029 isoform X1 [Aegilops tauschii subsp. strangulata]